MCVSCFLLISQPLLPSVFLLPQCSSSFHLSSPFLFSPPPTLFRSKSSLYVFYGSSLSPSSSLSTRHTVSLYLLVELFFLMSVSVILSLSFCLWLQIFPFSFSALSAAPHCPLPNFFFFVFVSALFLPQLSIPPPTFLNLCAVPSPSTSPSLKFLFSFCQQEQDIWNRKK